MLVKNLNGTSRRACRCGNWLEHWRRFSGELGIICSCCFCNETATEGCHVQKATSPDENWYIIPVCHACNMKSGENLHIWDQTSLIPATEHPLCG